MDCRVSLRWRLFQRLERVRRRLRLGWRLAWLPWRLAELILRRRLIPLDLPPASVSRPRWGYDRPPHPLIAGLLRDSEQRFKQSIAEIASYREALSRIEPFEDGSLAPYWRNRMCPPLDLASIYAFVRSRNPARYLEVGSGTSTRFAARAIKDGGLRTQIISVDPDPRIAVDPLCTQVVRSPLEDADLALFRRLEGGDVVFFDCSHRSFTNSDVTVFFVEVLPTLPAGVLVGVHDIFLPDDYPPDWWERYYSEQYLLSAWLLANPDRVRPVLACHYVSRQPGLAAGLEELWGHPNLREAVADARRVHAGELGLAFWFECGEAAGAKRAGAAPGG